MKRWLWLGVLLLAGCGSTETDPRVREGVGLLHHKTRKAANRFWMTDDPDRKIQIADEHFKKTLKFIEAFDAYLNDRKPDAKGEVVW